jgi:hypothetical protein
MREVIKSIVGAVIGVAVFAGVAGADHIEPKSAKKTRFDLVNSYFRCDTPNTATLSNGTGACTPAVLWDAFGCALSPEGSGKLTVQKIGSATDGTQDLKLTAVVKGLTANCEGQSLEIVLSYRLTTDDCPEGSCTTFDVEDAFAGTWCTVTNGHCKINTTLRTSNPSLIALSNENAGIEIHGCGLRRLGTLGPAGITCGLLLK